MQLRFAHFLLIILSSAGSPAIAQHNIKKDWQASWVAVDSGTTPNTFYKYKTSFKVSKKVKKAILSIAVDSRYWLWVNDKLVVLEGQLKRGPTPNDTYYDEVDITPYVNKTINTLAILHWYWGKHGFSHNSSGRAALLTELECNGKFIPLTWHGVRHLSYGNTAPPHPNFRLPEHNILYDARLDDESWISYILENGKQKSFNFKQWPIAQPVAAAGAAPWNQLWKRPIPQWSNSGLLYYTKSFKVGNQLVGVLPQNINVNPYFRINAKAGLKIDIRTDNYNGGGATNIRTEYITKDGIQEFESPAHFNGHKVIYTIPDGVEVLDIRYRASGYASAVAGSFDSDDPFLNTLWLKALATLRLNLRDGIYDCADRERAQWWGDIVINLEEMQYSLDLRRDAIIKKAISNLIQWQRNDSVLFSPIPAGNWNKELPGQILAAIYGIKQYILYSGDMSILKEVYEPLKKYLALWKLKDGVVQHRHGDWAWHDWGNEVDMDALDHIWYYIAVDAMAFMSKYHQPDDYNNYSALLDQLKTAFTKHLWKDNKVASTKYKPTADDRANGLAAFAGLTNYEQWKAIKNQLDTNYKAGPYLEKYILEAYYKNNAADAAYNRMKQRYFNMVRNDTISTLWEGWEIGSAIYGGGTINHAWTGGPLTLMSGYIAGVRPTAPGYDSFIVQPQLGQLKKVKTIVPTPKGNIFVSIFNGRYFYMTIATIDAPYVVALPKRIMTRPVKVNDKPIEEVITKFNEDDEFIYYNVPRNLSIAITN